MREESASCIPDSENIVVVFGYSLQNCFGHVIEFDGLFVHSEGGSGNSSFVERCCVSVIFLA